jgi:tRNA isopentenyl-2-thiomethyl-A-37 hydroxylase MiaE
VLSENIKDPELAKFYRDLMISEAGTIRHFWALPENMLTMLMLTSAGKNGLILKHPSL